MKNIDTTLTLLISILVMSSTLFAQTSQPRESKNEKMKAAPPVVKDANANGVDDSKENQQPAKRQGLKKRDQFIDANGDGICDSREEGLGFRHGKGQSTIQHGKRQQGRLK